MDQPERPFSRLLILRCSHSPRLFLYHTSDNSRKRRRLSHKLFALLTKHLYPFHMANVRLHYRLL